MAASNKGLSPVVVILLVAGLAVAGLLLLMGRLVTHRPATVDPVTPANSANHIATLRSARNSLPLKPETGTDEIVATVNNQIVTRQQWRQATLVDVALSQVINQPAPGAEETLDRLVSEIIILAQAPDVSSPSPADIEERITALEQSWDVSDQVIVTSLEEAGLSRDHLVARVGRLMQVESVLKQLAAQGHNLNQWLVRARAAARISLYQPLMASKLPQTSPLDEARATPLIVSQDRETEPAIYPFREIQLPGLSPDLAVQPYPNQLAPDFSLISPDGSTLTMSDFSGRPVLINFWASWCPPCRQDLAALQTAYDTYGSKAGFVAVNLKEPANTVTAFATEIGFTFPIALDQDGRVSIDTYQIRGLPTTVFVDARGMVKVRHVGPLEEAAISGYLTPLLEQAGQNQTVSTPAFDFVLTAANGTPVSLQDYRNKHHLVLVFYRGQT